MKQEYTGFSISADYRTSTVWFFGGDGRLRATFKTRIDKGKTRRERYDLQTKALGCSKIQIPAFTEKQAR